MVLYWLESRQILSKYAAQDLKHCHRTKEKGTSDWYLMHQNYVDVTHQKNLKVGRGRIGNKSF